MERRRRHWAISGLMAVGTHLAVVVGFLLGVSPHYQRVEGRSAVRDASELAITFDLVPPVEAAVPPAEPTPLVERSVTPRRGHTPRRMRPLQDPLPVRVPAGPNPLEPPALQAAEGDQEDQEAPPADRGTEGGGAGSGTAALPSAEPIAISAGEAGYLRISETYPALPRSLWVWGRVYTVLAQVCVSARGQVSDVSIKRGAAPELDRAVSAAMHSWQYRPRLVEGAPRPFCHLIKLDFSLR
jgi:outer membrane biosynthesis protein TonB